MFDYIELFYNPLRRHGFTNQLSPVEFERQYLLKNGTVKETRGDSHTGLLATHTGMTDWNERPDRIGTGTHELKRRSSTGYRRSVHVVALSKKLGHRRDAERVQGLGTHLSS